ncbi:MAG: superoxide dismutase family protein [Parvularculaceae bacterium]|nr:superoxide dismutase family protein [Parvularculaceae bacterium]
MRLPVILILAPAILLVACAKKEKAPAAFELAPAGWAEASGPFVDAKGATVGEAAFRSSADGIMVRVTVTGLSPGWHAIHFHQVGDCSDRAAGFKLSGGHVNAAGVEHGLMNPKGSETGDLPNIYAGADGRATAELFRAAVVLKPSEEAAAALGPNPLLDTDGFAVVVHAAADDHLTQPIGGAGAWGACAAIKG